MTTFVNNCFNAMVRMSGVVANEIAKHAGEAQKFVGEGFAPEKVRGFATDQIKKFTADPINSMRDAGPSVLKGVVALFVVTTGVVALQKLWNRNNDPQPPAPTTTYKATVTTHKI